MFDDDLDITAVRRPELEVDLRPQLEQVRDLLSSGCLTAALERFLELRRKYTGHWQLKMMPLAVPDPDPGGGAQPIDERTTQRIVLCAPA